MASPSSSKAPGSDAPLPPPSVFANAAVPASIERPSSVIDGPLGVSGEEEASTAAKVQESSRYPSRYEKL